MNGLEASRALKGKECWRGSDLPDYGTSLLASTLWLAIRPRRLAIHPEPPVLIHRTIHSAIQAPTLERSAISSYLTAISVRI